uniref:GRF-type domain-containing protein n=1 Tax=Davidia involucrata TaxID=16924 RepID=A0A5B7BEX0_DAVIN
MSSSSTDQSSSKGLRYANKSCNCGRKAGVKITQSDGKNNKGRLYYTCETKSCSFFEWCDPSTAAVEHSSSMTHRLTFGHNENRGSEVAGDISEIKSELRGIYSRLQMLELGHGMLKVLVIASLVMATFALLVGLVAVLLK